MRAATGAAAAAVLCIGLLASTPCPARAMPAPDVDRTDVAKADAATTKAATTSTADPAAGRTGREVYERFRAGLADPDCSGESSRWRQHFATAPKQLANGSDDLLPLFGYVVDALRESHLPTEYALIPFVESGYKPGARSPQGPAGLWQMITITARDHQVPIRAGYDGRLSPIDSTRAAVRYLKTLHGMFAGDWRLAVMAYNAGEYRVLAELKRSGQRARDVDIDKLTGMPAITRAYVRKLHALSCLMEQADDRDEWLRALERPVPRLHAVDVPAGIADIATWSRRNGHDATRIARLNPAHAGGRIAHAGKRTAQLLVPVDTAVGAVTTSADASTVAPAATPAP